MKILILGSRGFIGSHLAAACIANGDTVTGCDRIEDTGVDYTYHKVSVLSSDFDTILDTESFDVCVNASGSGNVPFSLTHPMSDFEANAQAVIKVLDTIRKYRPACKYIHISSAAVYGNPKTLPIQEADTLNPLSPYGYHKWMSEIICKEFFHLYNLPVAIVRPFSVYGTGLKKQLLWDICHKLHRQDTISLFGTGNETRDFIHVSDLASLILAIIQNCGFAGEVYNAASGQETSIKEISNIFSSCFGGAKQISFSGNVRSGDPLNWRADISKANKIGFIPQTTLTDGVSAYVKWFKSLPA